ncbi:MAG: cyclic nucleotide-binding domain-containing protein [Spirochaetales bacterium]|nr:cyclic nucleotide-binding domain-containing protein [Spirochaetales bacterium]
MKLERNTYAQYVKTLEPNSTIFCEGDAGEELYIIIDGEVEIRKTTTQETSKTLIQLKKGDIFGEMSLIEGKPRSATAVTAKKTQLLCVNDELFETMLSKNPDFSRKIIKMLSERLRKANMIIKSIMSTNKLNQLLGGLHEYARENGTSTFKGYRVNIPQFMDWASRKLGITHDESKALVESLKKRKIVTASALGDNEIILSTKR